MTPSGPAPSPSYATLPRLPHSPATVLDHLARRFPHVGLAAWESRLSRGLVRFDGGEPVTAATPYRPGARVVYYREVAREPEVPFAEEILYRDERLLVADKPHFLPVVPGGPYVHECLLYRLRRATGLAGLRAVHRLDRETAGLVIFGLGREAASRLGELFMNGRVEKEYLAVARLTREPRGTVWEVENRLERGEPWFRMRLVEGAPNASTRVELLERRDGLGLFRLLPRTGKKHQLRVHLASLGFPVVGDRFYPDLEPEAPPDFSRPLLLVAKEVRFHDPWSGRELRFRSLRRADWPRSTSA